MGMWGYLMLYGAPKEAREVFTNLGISSESNVETRVIDVVNIQNKDTNLSLTGSNLQQLTTRAVAGFGFVKDKAELIVYIEKGTGYMYEINTKESSEKQISLTTIPKIAEAVFSPNGNTVVLTSYEGYNKKVILGRRDSKNQALLLFTLPQNAENISFVDDQTLYFSIENESGTKGYSYNLVKDTQTEVFNLKLTDLKVIWGDTHTGISVQTKPTASQEGYLYTVSKNSLTPQKAKGYGLITFSDSTYTIGSTIEDSQYLSIAYGKTQEIKQPILMLPEKCAFDTKKTTEIWCASPLTTPKGSYLENWYKGAITSDDYLWYSDLTTQSSKLVGNFKKLSGKTIDVENLTLNKEESLLIFTNKIDQTLWMYTTEEGN
jgi:hypothetical protein